MDSGIDSDMMLAATSGPNYEPSLRYAQLQQAQQTLQQGAENHDQALAAGAQTVAENAVKLRQMQMQQDDLDAMRAAWHPPTAATPPPAPQPPQAGGRVAGPNDPVTPGIVGITPTAPQGQGAGPNSPITPGIIGVTPTAPQTPAAASPQVQGTNWTQNLDAVDARVQASNASPMSKMAFHAQVIAHKEADAKLQDAQGKVADQEKDFMTGIGSFVQKGGYTPASVENALSFAENANNGAYAPHVAQLRQFLQAHPDQTQPTFDLFANGGTAPMVTAQSKMLTAQGTSAADAQKLGDARYKDGLQQLSGMLDPSTGMPANRAAYDQLSANYPELKLPGAPSAAQISGLLRSGVPIEKQPEFDISQLKAKNGIVGTDKFDTIFLPAYAANLGKTVAQLTPQEKMASFSSFKQYDTNPEMLQSILSSREATMAMHQSTLDNQQFQHGQQSYQFHAHELDTLGKPVEDAVQRFGRLQDTLGQNNPQADALIGPELLSVMAGGSGSGLRMNEAEIARVIGGRSQWEDLKASVNKWQLDPKEARSITPAQDQQIRSLVGVVGQKLAAKQTVLNSARQSLGSTNDPMQHRQILADTHQKLTGVDGNVNTGAAGSLSVTDPKGGVHTFSNQASADAFKRAAGIK
jgi:hypothetical protein